MLWKVETFCEQKPLQKSDISNLTENCVSHAFARTHVWYADLIVHSIRRKIVAENWNPFFTKSNLF